MIKRELTRNIKSIGCSYVATKYFSSGYTHGGIFHADEVFSCAFLQILDPEFTIERGFNPPIEEGSVLIFDIGNGEYDHHSLPREERANGIPYAAFGKLWRDFAPAAFGEVVAAKIDIKLVSEIDAVDNGVEGSQSNISRFIHELNPLWNETCSNHDQFWLAVSYAKVILEREIKAAQAVVEAEAIVSRAIKTAKDPHILVLDKYVPWVSYAVLNPDLLYAIYPSVRGGWCMQVVPINDTSKEARKDVPAEWKGFRVGSSEAPIEGMTFCHPSGFLSSFETKEQAIAAAEYLIK